MKIKIQTISAWNIIATILVTLIFICIYGRGENEFKTYQNITEQYVLCKEAASQMQKASDYLTEQVRLYTLTGEREYLDSYFYEANTRKRRENALTRLEQYSDGTSNITALRAALDHSQELMNTEYYAMRLILELYEPDTQNWPSEVLEITPEEADASLSEQEKLQKAQHLVSNKDYQTEKHKIADEVSACTADLLEHMKQYQERSESNFSTSYQNLQYGIIPLAILMIGICFIMNRQVVKPLCQYSESIKRGEFLPITGAAELQNLAKTYNYIYQENKETQELFCYQAEHDSLTGLFNRGAFDKRVQACEKNHMPYALIIADIDSFKEVNDTYGHAVGDAVIQRVAALLKKNFRDIDSVCRIGGDEFAIIMADMTNAQKNIIEERIQWLNFKLKEDNQELPIVSLSIGIAFSNGTETQGSTFKGADNALYYVKKHGKDGCAFH